MDKDYTYIKIFDEIVGRIENETDNQYLIRKVLQTSEYDGNFSLILTDKAYYVSKELIESFNIEKVTVPSHVRLSDSICMDQVRVFISEFFFK